MKILVVGISVRALAASAVRSGYRVLGLDAFGDRDLKLITEAYSLHRDFDMTYSPGALCQAARLLSCDAIVYAANLENYPAAIERIADGRKLIGNSPQTVEAVRAWPDLFSRLTRAGFPVPETIFAGDSRKGDARRRWLRKPMSGGGGHGIVFWTSRRFPAGRHMLQEYLPGKPCSASFVANGQDCVVLGIAGQLIGLHPFGCGGFRYCGNILPLPEMAGPRTDGFLLDQVRGLAKFLTRAYGLTGVNGIDFILKGGRAYVTEVNPRYSASMELIEQAYDLPIFDLHARAVLHGQLPEFKLEDALCDKKFVGKAILFAERNAVAPDTKGWLDSGARDIPAAGEELRKGSPICTVLAGCPTYEDTLDELARRASRLKESMNA
jgi:uncharacterized protein